MKDINEFFSHKCYDRKININDVINETNEKIEKYNAIDGLQDVLVVLLNKYLKDKNDIMVTRMIVLIGVLGLIKECYEDSDAECVKTINDIKNNLRNLKKRGLIWKNI